MGRIGTALCYALAIAAIILVSPAMLVVSLVNETWESAEDSYKTPF